MPRKRTIDPNIWDDEDFLELSANAKVLWFGLISMADDDGRQRANKHIIKKNFFSRERGGIDWAERVRNEVLRTMRNTILYKVGKEEFVQLTNWEKYQRQRDDRRVKSSFPAPTKDNIVDVGQMTDECQTDDGQVPAEVKLSKVKLSKVNYPPAADYQRISDRIITEINKTFKSIRTDLIPSKSFFFKMVKEYGENPLVDVLGRLREAPNFREIKEYASYIVAILKANKNL